MTYKSYETNKTYTGKGPGYESLVVYWLGTTISDLNAIFCERFIDRKSRTYDQMIQGARSGKQCLVEGSTQKSVEGNLKLTSVARASYAELLEDYRDFLRQKNLLIWGREDPRVVQIRRTPDLPYKTYTSYTTYTTYMKTSEGFANLMLTLCYKQGYLLDQLLRSIERRFIQEGGFRENLFRRRREYIGGGGR